MWNPSEKEMDNMADYYKKEDLNNGAVKRPKSFRMLYNGCMYSAKSFKGLIWAVMKAKFKIGSR